MKNPTQITNPLLGTQQLKNTWAFAVDTNGFANKRHQITRLKNCVISSCSKEAKLLGIRAGMHYADAKALIPHMRILVIGGRNV